MRLVARRPGTEHQCCAEQRRCTDRHRHERLALSNDHGVFVLL